MHVTGTNGKGTFVEKTAKALQLSGYNVGKFTSPHILSLRERIMINDQPIEKDFLASFINIHKEIEKEGINLSFFEFLFLTSLQYFKLAKVDIALIEVGLGGSKDATNIFENPHLSVITGIGLDHTEFLGNSIEEITSNTNLN